ncbi:MAG TPA: hypothetical protein VHS05_02285 [Pyrinomonadaceae bacterium]|nr:hypothetical protein [Pyrinomonadaceae bacterium]
MFSKQVYLGSLTTFVLNTVRTVMLITAASCAYSQTVDSSSFQPHHISITLRVVERTPTILKFYLQLKNVGEHAVLIVSEPVRIDGSKGMYLALGKGDSSLLEVSSQIFPPPNYDIVVPKHRVTYKMLAPGTDYEEEIVLQTPLTETEPPWREMLTPRDIDLTKIQYVEVRVGVLPDEPEVRQAIERSSTGLEIVKSGPLKGKPLFAIQSLLSSKIKL